MVELDAVSIRCTLSSASFETHKDPSPSATPLGLRPTVLVATTLTVLGFNLVGDALRDLYDPKLGRTQRRVT